MQSANRGLALFALAASFFFHLVGCKATQPSHTETKVIQEGKDLVIGGKDLRSPLRDSASTIRLGAQQFQNHCRICHGFDGHATGVPFARNMSPPIPDLGSADIQKYTDGQLKWITENGIRLTGMPGWKGLIDDIEIWQIVSYIRHLPPRRAPK
jgi:S-disulfanyl-L-cysteine oxidoreductase SoxD